MTESNGIKIRVKGVNKRFGDKDVLNDVNLEIAADKKTVLIGPAASGKTVLMKCLAGLHRPESGSIEIDGKPVPLAGDPDHVPFMQSVGLVFQQGGLFDSLTIWENISFKLMHSLGMDRAEAKKIATEKLAMVNLPATTGDLMPSELSGGMQKRAGIARALVGDPSLILMDEPTAGLDPITTAAINRLIDHCIHEIGATVLSITSDMDSARREYDNLAMIHEGHIMWSGAVSDIDDSGNEYVLQLINGHGEGPIKMRLKARA